MTEADVDYLRLIYFPREPGVLASDYSALLTGWLTFPALGLHHLRPFSAPDKASKSKKMQRDGDSKCLPPATDALQLPPQPHGDLDGQKTVQDDFLLPHSN